MYASELSLHHFVKNCLAAGGKMTCPSGDLRKGGQWLLLKIASHSFKESLVILVGLRKERFAVLKLFDDF